MNLRTPLLACGLALLCACTDELPTESRLAPQLDIDTTASDSLDLGVLPDGWGSVAWAVSAGTVVGESKDSLDRTRAFRWTESSGMQDLGTFGGDHSAAFGINAAGVVVGSADTVDGSYRAFLWTQAGGMQSLGGENSQANDVNASNTVVGSYTESESGELHGFSWSAGGGFVDLAPIADGYRSEAFAINDAGVVVGQSSVGTGALQAFRLVPGDSMETLGTLPAGIPSAGTDVNSDGVIVGWSGPSSAMRAFVWTESGGMLQLPSRPGSVLEQAHAINDDGEIVGFSSAGMFQERAVLWTPNGDGSYTIHDVASATTFAYDVDASGSVVGYTLGMGGTRATRWLFGIAGQAPYAPTSLGATLVSGSRVDLAWTDESPNETYFRVERQTRNDANTGYGPWTLLADLAPDSTAFSDTTPQAGRLARWRVRACNASGCAGPQTLPLYVDDVAATPTAFTAVGHPDSVRVSWAHSGNANRFALTRSAWNPGTSSYGPYVALFDVAGTARSALDTTVVQGTRYRYRMRACNPVGCSAFIVLAPPVVADYPPAIPANANVSTPSSGTILFTWGNVAGETYFEVLRRVQNPSTLVWGTFDPAGTTAQNVTSFSDPGRTAGTRYRYRVRACNLAGCSDWLQSAIIQAN